MKVYKCNQCDIYDFSIRSTCHVLWKGHGRIGSKYSGC